MVPLPKIKTFVLFVARYFLIPKYLLLLSNLVMNWIFFLSPGQHPLIFTNQFINCGLKEILHTLISRICLHPYMTPTSELKQTVMSENLLMVQNSTTELDLDFILALQQRLSVSWLFCTRWRQQPGHIPSAGYGLRFHAGRARGRGGAVAGRSGERRARWQRRAEEGDRWVSAHCQTGKKQLSVLWRTFSPVPDFNMKGLPAFEIRGKTFFSFFFLKVA